MTDQNLRIGDAEREQAAAELGEHYAQGRLTMEEHAERLDQIWAARTRGELTPIFGDLPSRFGQAPPAYPTVASLSGRRWSGPPRRRGIPGPLMVVLAVLVVFTVVTHLPLILLGLVLWWFLIARHHRFTGPRRW